MGSLFLKKSIGRLYQVLYEFTTKERECYYYEIFEHLV